MRKESVKSIPTIFSIPYPSQQWHNFSDRTIFLLHFNLKLSSIDKMVIIS